MAKLGWIRYGQLDRRAVAFLVVFRVLNVLCAQTYFVPDEYWQGPEVAHRLVFGYGWSAFASTAECVRAPVPGCTCHVSALRAPARRCPWAVAERCKALRPANPGRVLAPYAGHCCAHTRALDMGVEGRAAGLDLSSHHRALLQGRPSHGHRQRWRSPAHPAHAFSRGCRSGRLCSF